ncbi:uncharacterized protein EI90DRAFT_155654 [Cantharellus anzutake]|uniref:uncharacterized protein n=1 Tax=Cantharellus anzutake TaxID=1750568 RepID=UPI001904ED4B|nr:uncharacterized protein EI90DRAFT_155654 [Cantharellus anzutake]KAF8336280.1 hypothetical protein EI90DRAFT_155654 [Cantharellus anzutake]
MTPINLGTLPNNPLPAVTRISDNGLFIIRVPRNADSPWYDSLTLISISGDPHMQHLAPPTSNNFTPTSSPPILASDFSTSPSASIKTDPDDLLLAIPHRRTLGFSPGACYVGAFDGLSAFTWSTEGEVADIHHSETHAGHNLDGSWIKCPFYVLLPSEEPEESEGWMKKLRRLEIHSSAAGRAPLFGTRGKRRGIPVLFNGKLEFIIPQEYDPVVFTGAKALDPAKMGLESFSKAGRQLQLLLILAKSFRIFVVNCNILLFAFARSTHRQRGNREISLGRASIFLDFEYK